MVTRTWREIDRIRKRPDVAQGIARSLIETFPAADFSDSESDFLHSLVRFERVQEFTRLQIEWLLLIQDELREATEVYGFSIHLLLKQCFEARLDLSEDDEEWITLRRETNPHAVPRKFVRRLLRCSCALYLIDREWHPPLPEQFKFKELTYDPGVMKFKKWSRVEQRPEHMPAEQREQHPDQHVVDVGTVGSGRRPEPADRPQDHEDGKQQGE
jgi:hypothetical protein